jgi:hypothetical protein
MTSEALMMYVESVLTARILALEPPLSVTGRQWVTSRRTRANGLPYVSRTGEKPGQNERKKRDCVFVLDSVI